MVLILGACRCSHTANQLHPDPAIDRVLTVAERKRLQSIPDDVPLKVCVLVVLFRSLEELYVHHKITELQCPSCEPHLIYLALMYAFHVATPYIVMQNDLSKSILHDFDCQIGSL